MIPLVGVAVTAIVAATLGYGHYYDRSEAGYNNRIASLPNHQILQQYVKQQQQQQQQQHQRQYQAFVVGGTGAVGKQLVRELVESDSCSRVVTLTRRPIEVKDENDQRWNQKLKQIIVSDNDQYLDHKYIESVVVPEIKDFEVAFSAFGTTRKNAGSAKEFERVDRDMNIFYANMAFNSANIPHYSLVSSIGANKDSWLLYPRCKGEIEHEIAQMAKGADNRTAAIFRPSILIAERPRDPRLAEAIAQKMSPFVSSVVCVGPLRHYKEITVEDVALAMRSDFEMRWRQDVLPSPRSYIYESDQIQLIVDELKKQGK